MSAYQEVKLASVEGLTIVSWDDLAGEGDAYAPAGLAGLAGSFQAEGAFTAAVLQASNDNNNFHAVRDLQGAEVVLTEPGIVDFSTSAAYIRAFADGEADVTVALRD